MLETVCTDDGFCVETGDAIKLHKRVCLKPEHGKWVRTDHIADNTSTGIRYWWQFVPWFP
jgi:hypothetical protein